MEINGILSRTSDFTDLKVETEIHGWTYLLYKP